MRRLIITEASGGQDKLTADLVKVIARADTKAVLEVIYLPYKAKRRTKRLPTEVDRILDMLFEVLKYDVFGEGPVGG